MGFEDTGTGVLEYWGTGVLGNWGTGELECWSVGVLECSLACRSRGQARFLEADDIFTQQILELLLNIIYSNTPALQHSKYSTLVAMKRGSLVGAPLLFSC